MIISIKEMKAIEQRAFAAGVEAAPLMEEASRGISQVIQQFFPHQKRLIVYAGQGNNGGDALQAATFLQEQGWQILLRLAADRDDLSPLIQKHLDRLVGGGALILTQPFDQQPRLLKEGQSWLILDGLLGIGAQGVPRGVIAQLCLEIEKLQQRYSYRLVAVDLPSAMTLLADLTVTLGWVKKELLADGATNFVGRLARVLLPALEPFLELDSADEQKEEQEVDTAHQDHVIESCSLSSFLPHRHFDVYKGYFGHLGIVAGSRGFLGAAELVALGALKGGVGKVTLYALADQYPLLALRVPPEVMVKPIASFSEVIIDSTEILDALVVGPGGGREHDLAFRELVATVSIPMVVDADALNAIAAQSSSREVVAFFRAIEAPRLLTPHPGEMEQLFPKNPYYSRQEWASEFLKKTQNPYLTLLLKGARTLVATQDRGIAYNMTGNPGMASGGMGDLLSGVLGAFLAQKILPYDAAQLGAWLCGRAAELALIDQNCSEESFSATTLAHYLGGAMNSLRNHAF